MEEDAELETNDARTPLPMMVWLSDLDSSVCEECDAMDGIAIQWGDEWPDDAPGEVHPGCRCLGVALFGHEDTSMLGDSESFE